MNLQCLIDDLTRCNFKAYADETVYRDARHAAETRASLIDLANVMLETHELTCGSLEKFSAGEAGERGA